MGNQSGYRFKDDDASKEAPPNVYFLKFSTVEGWMRLSIKTANIEARYPPILNEDDIHPKANAFKWVDPKNPE